MALLFAILLSFYIKSVVSTTNKTGFSLELVHSDSIRSLIYHENLTEIEKFEQLKNLSDARVKWLEMTKINNKSQEMVLRPIADHDMNFYFVKVYVSNDRIPQNLFFDTGSDLTWIQCRPCSPCFPQKPPFYVPLDSRTYTNLDCNHPFCKAYECNEGTCRYIKSYGDNALAGGVLATESFEGIDGFIFGCTQSATANSFPENTRISGIIGMDGSQQSFTMQLSRYTQGRFSHCFVPNFAGTISYLRFGSDIIEKSYYQRTPILRTNSNLYYLQLNDVTIDNQRLNLPRGIFNQKPDNTGGCIIDSGSSFTYIMSEAYEIIEAELMRYFSRYSMTPISRGGERTQLCYKTRGKFRYSLPSMTLHFDGADLKLESFNIFCHMGNNKFCLWIATRKETIIGVMMQQDIRFVYDLNRWELSFGRERCAGT